MEQQVEQTRALEIQMINNSSTDIQGKCPNSSNHILPDQINYVSDEAQPQSNANEQHNAKITSTMQHGGLDSRKSKEENDLELSNKNEDNNQYGGSVQVLNFQNGSGENRVDKAKYPNENQ